MSIRADVGVPIFSVGIVIAVQLMFISCHLGDLREELMLERITLQRIAETLETRK